MLRQLGVLAGAYALYFVFPILAILVIIWAIGYIAWLCIEDAYERLGR